jgi:hypothetical protein
MKIAILDTSTAREVKWAPNGNDVESTCASERLLELLAAGYTVFIASTRTKLYPQFDSCVTDLIPTERFFHVNPELDHRGSDSLGLVDVWVRVLTAAGIDVPPIVTDNGCDNTSWTSLRWYAKDQGVVIY